MHIFNIFHFFSNWLNDFKTFLWDDGSWQEYWCLADWLNTEDIIYMCEICFSKKRSIISVDWEIKGIKEI